MGFKLFGRKALSPEERVGECRKKRDWAGLARAYYELGAAAMDRGNLHLAHLWLHRADTICSARDDIYEKVGEKLIDDCSERIGKLEEAPIFYNTVPARMEEQTESLGDALVRVWGLFSLARLVRLGEQLSVLPGCEVLGRLGWAVDTVFRSFQTPPTEDAFNGLKELCGELYALGDSEAFFGGGEVEVSGGEPLQVFDLNGMMGVHTAAEAYLDSHLRMIAALSQEQEPPAPETDILTAALLPDYYVRTQGEKLEAIPQIQAELHRIEDDLAFARSGVSWEQVGRRLEDYKHLDLFQPDVACP